MQVTVENTEGLGRKMTITVPADVVDKAVNVELRNIAKNRRFDGFRKGKVPVSLVSRMYGDAVRNDVMGDVMQRQFIDAIVEQKINPAGAPTFTPVTTTAGQDLVFDASFEVYPAVEIKDLEKVEIVKPVASVKESDLEQMLETLCKQQASWAEADTNAEATSRVTLDFTGSIDGEEFEGGKAESFALVMGQNRMIPGFEDGIVGKKAGDEFEIDVTFPEEYHAENLKGKAAKFAIKLHKVEAQQLPEMNEEFVKRFGVESGQLEDLKAEIRKNMERELKQAVKNNIKEQALNGLVENNEIEVPSVLIDQEVNVLRKQAAQRFGGDEKTTAQLPRELFEEQAVRRIKVGLLLGEIISSEALKVDEERVKEALADMASAYEDPAEVIAYYQKDKRLMENMHNVVLEDQAVDVIVAKANVSEKETDFTELMNPSQA